MPRAQPVVVGIDAGGTTTRARAVCDGVIVHDGVGGPANPDAADPATVRASFVRALGGCPEPTRMVASVAGAGLPANAARLRDVLHDLHPGAQVDVVPDYVAAFAAAPSGTAVCVIAGTGSVVCSRVADGSFATSGGRGWLLGDHGSAANLGAALLAGYVDDPDGAPSDVRAAIRDLFGTDEWRVIVAEVQNSPAVARTLATAAPLLTRFAEQGYDFAVTSLHAAMDRLAGTVARHIAAFVESPARVALAGGVWTSDIAVTTFVQALARQCPGAVVDPARVTPLDGAVSLAMAAQ